MDSASARAAQFKELWRLGMSTLRPEPIVFFKPTPTGKGGAAKFNLSLQPTYKPGENYVDAVDGGLFVDLVAQGDKNLAGYPTFKWTEKETMITAKLGLPDVSALLASIRDFRVRGVEVATYLRGKQKPQPNQVSLFHQSDTSGTTGISYTFGDEDSVLRISKSKDKFRSISLNLGEEVILQAYLEYALNAFIRVGKR